MKVLISTFIFTLSTSAWGGSLFSCFQAADETRDVRAPLLRMGNTSDLYLYFVDDGFYLFGQKGYTFHKGTDYGWNPLDHSVMVLHNGVVWQMGPKFHGPQRIPLFYNQKVTDATVRPQLTDFSLKNGYAEIGPEAKTLQSMIRRAILDRVLDGNRRLSEVAHLPNSNNLLRGFETHSQIAKLIASCNSSPIAEIADLQKAHHQHSQRLIALASTALSKQMLSSEPDSQAQQDHKRIYLDLKRFNLDSRAERGYVFNSDDRTATAKCRLSYTFFSEDCKAIILSLGRDSVRDTINQILNEMTPRDQRSQDLVLLFFERLSYSSDQQQLRILSSLISWVREFNEQWSKVLDRKYAQLAIDRVLLPSMWKVFLERLGFAHVPYCRAQLSPSFRGKRIEHLQSIDSVGPMAKETLNRLAEKLQQTEVIDYVKTDLTLDDLFLVLTLTDGGTELVVKTLALMEEQLLSIEADPQLTSDIGVALDLPKGYAHRIRHYRFQPSRPLGELSVFLVLYLGRTVSDIDSEYRLSWLQEVSPHLSAEQSSRYETLARKVFMPISSFDKVVGQSLFAGSVQSHHQPRLGQVKTVSHLTMSETEEFEQLSRKRDEDIELLKDIETAVIDQRRREWKQGLSQMWRYLHTDVELAETCSEYGSAGWSHSLMRGRENHLANSPEPSSIWELFKQGIFLR